MAINFLDAIVDVGKAQDAVTIAKLKSHSKVGYQDHPMGEASCSTCSMFMPAEKSPDGEPACSLVKPPISPHGWCEDYDAHDRSDDVRERLAAMLGVQVGKDGPPDEARDERGRWTTGGGGGSSSAGRVGGASARYTSPYRTRVRSYIPGAELPKVRAEQQMREAEQKVADLQRQLSEHSQDKSEDLYWGVHRMLQQARNDLANLKSKIPTQKAFNPDEPRDAIGRWTSGETGPDHPDFMHGSEGDALASATSEVTSGMSDNISKIEDAHANLDQAATDAEEVSAEEDDHYDENGDIKDVAEYDAWEKRNSAALADVADKTMALRNAVADHLQATAGVLSQLDARIQQHANENGVRGK